MSSMPKKLILPAALIATVAAAATYQTDGPGASAPVVDAPPRPLPLDAAPRVAVNDPSIGLAVNEWNRLRQSDSLSFGEYAAFLVAHPGWPGELGFRRAAEKAIRVDQEPPAQVIALFQRLPPLTGVGHARYADARERGPGGRGAGGGARRLDERRPAVGGGGARPIPLRRRLHAR